MRVEDVVAARAAGACELCGSKNNVTLYEVPPQDQRNADNCIMLCDVCRAQVDKKAEPARGHWKCLTDSMWSDVPGVQVVAWRLPIRLRNESWAADNLDMLYLDDEKLEWAKATGDHENDDAVELHKDANGNILQNGDTVVLTKSLDVKGSTLNAKLGTVVKNIRLVENNSEQVEGRVEGQLIVILTRYLRKQNEKV